MLKIWGRISSINVRKVVWCAQELGLSFQRGVVGFRGLVGDLLAISLPAPHPQRGHESRGHEREHIGQRPAGKLAVPVGAKLLLDLLKQIGQSGTPERRWRRAPEAGNL